MPLKQQIRKWSTIAYRCDLEVGSFLICLFDRPLAGDPQKCALVHLRTATKLKPLFVYRLCDFCCSAFCSCRLQRRCCCTFTFPTCCPYADVNQATSSASSEMQLLRFALHFALHLLPCCRFALIINASFFE